MSNFNFIDVKSNIDRKEVNTIKQAIFQRAKEKSQALVEEKSSDYTSSVKNDVMEIAQEEFNKNGYNPFNNFLENMGISNTQEQNITTSKEPAKEVNQIINDVEKPAERKYRFVKRNIESASDSTYKNSMRDETMDIARRQFQFGTNLQSSLNFLNTQAAIEISKRKQPTIDYTS